MKRRLIIHTLILLGWGTLFFSTGWDDAHPDYIRLEIASRIFMTIMASGICVLCVECGRLIK